jgi:phosphatidylinositol glycan class A protein
MLTQAASRVTDASSDADRLEAEEEGANLQEIASPKGTDAHQHYHSIMMISDFFYPDAGGVENHMFMLSQCLLQLGHKVIVCTRARGNRQGVRWLTRGLKVYYLPLMPMPDVFSSGRVSLPTLFSSFPILRNICIREGISIVHGHQAFSILCHEGLLHAGTMGLKTIFTDHSLFGFSDPSAIHMNKVLNFTCSITNHVICVSHTSKENTVLRANIPPLDVSVIPNAVDTSIFTPNPAARKSNSITIVCITRLVYRKGVDLMVEIIPQICKQFDHVNFVIGGDGPMRVALDQMRENHQLQDRVEMLGQVKHTDVRNVLVRGHIYLNCSLTEAFCIAILEAASCGLLVVSTKVGGVPEVMPAHMIKYAHPDPEDLTRVLARAIMKDVKDVVPHEFHNNVRRMYSWRDVALRTCKGVACTPYKFQAFY